MADKMSCPGPVSVRLNFLYEHIRDPETGKPFSDRYVTEAINSTAGTKILGNGDLHYLRKGGRRSRPKRHKLLAIAEFFNVPIDYFDDPWAVDRVKTHIDVLAAVADPRVYNIAIKAAGLPPKVLDAVALILDQERDSAGTAPATTCPAIPPIAAAPQPDPDRWKHVPFDQIRCNDLRLVEIAGEWLYELGDVTIADAVAHDHTAGLRLDQHAPALCAWADRMATATLDEVASDLLDVLERHRPPLSRRTRWAPAIPRSGTLPHLRGAITARLGLHGKRPQSLTQAAAMAGVSRERVRQVTQQIEAAATARVWAPSLDQALALADGSLTGVQFQAELLKGGLAVQAWHPQAVASLARLCGRQQQLRLTGEPSPQDQQRTGRAIIGIATRLITTRDIITLDELQHALSESTLPADIETITAAVAASPRLLTAGQWITFTSATTGRGRLHRAMKGMLAIAGQLPAETLNSGLRRRRARAQLHDPLPGPEALTALLTADPTYIVHEKESGQTIVRLREPLTPAKVYPATSCSIRLIRHLQQAPEQRATRAELVQVAIDHGMSAYSASVAIQQHEAFEQCARGWWTLTGAHPKPAAATASPTAGYHQAGSRADTSDAIPHLRFIVSPALRKARRIERVALAKYTGEYQLEGAQGGQPARIRIYPPGRADLTSYLGNHSHADGTALILTLDTHRHTATITKAIEGPE